MACASKYILDYYPNECAGLKLASWALFSLYIVNFIWQGMCMVGLEKQCCNTCGVISVAIFDAIILMFAQATYFKS
jgi:hypothetical protein